MTYKVSWQVPQQVLFVALGGDLSMDEFSALNQAITSHLSNLTDNLAVTIIIDTTQLRSVPHAYQQLKATQTYVQRRDLQYILIVGSNKMIRLMMLLTFNLCRPALRFFDDLEKAHAFIRLMKTKLDKLLSF